ncbi:segregation/condensation protein A, partial [Streptomyces sp. SID6041]|nr:segregation/condensation protein A [Streptomyces sp. SID6041]
MHHAPDETSRPPRRRTLGRGPGDPPAAPPAEGEAEVPMTAPAPREAGPAAGPELAAAPVPLAGPEPEPEPVRVVEPASPGAPVGPVPPDSPDGRFTVRLANFEGPFDLLLQLITKHKLDVTEVALSRVTDEFMAHLRALGPDGDLDQTTEFLVVAATLLDLKAARLL